MSDKIIEHYHNSVSRLLLLDYDGTLIEFTRTAADTVPTSELLELLSRLANDDHNTVVIISGRPREPFGSWLGNLPLYLVAEHGLFIKSPGEDWRATRPLDQSWKPAVRHLMDSVAVPGAEIEEKTMALVWDFQNADPDNAELAAAGLVKQLHGLGSSLKIMLGHSNVEATASGTDKGQAVRYWLAKGEYDFILGAGDDTTDEDLFQALPASSHKLKVGGHWPAGETTYNTPAEFRAFLASLVTTTTRITKT